MNTEILIAIIGLFTTITGSWLSWFVTRRKYNAEVDSNEIKNLADSLSFYENIVKDNNQKLAFYIKLSETNRIEVYRLKGVIHRLLNNSCLDNKCVKRQFYTEEQIRDILGDLTPQNKVYEELKIDNTESNGDNIVQKDKK